MTRSAFAAALMILSAGGATALPAKAPTIQAAIDDPTRPADDKARDAERKPAAMLAFAGVKPGMTVVDMLPGGGYFTRLFSDAVGPTGKVYAYVPDEALAKGTKALDRAQAAAAGRSNVTVVHHPLLAPAPGAVADIAWTSQNYHDLHNIPGVDVVAFNRQVLAALKPGGVYVVEDHAAAAGTGLQHTNDLHRIDPEAVKAEVIAAGFVLDGESKVLANGADDHAKPVFDPAIRGHTDQFLLRFRKPAA